MWGDWGKYLGSGEAKGEGWGGRGVGGLGGQKTEWIGWGVWLVPHGQTSQLEGGVRGLRCKGKGKGR